MTLNQVTENLPPYPMEEFNKIKRRLRDKGQAVFDFSTGDPRLPTPPFIREALLNHVEEVSQYPSIRGLDSLAFAQWNYLNRRFGIEKSDLLDMLPTSGSKEAIFHTALSLVGRSGGKKHILYPNPGYPIYRSSTLFAGGIPVPVELQAEAEYLLEPWKLPKHIQKDAAALWINYPHNPTGAVANSEYYKRIVDWAVETDTILLSDECYVDMYDASIDESGDPDQRPDTILNYGTQNVIAYHSLSKRSGMTGYRAGFMAGDATLIGPMTRARANFGVGMSDFVQQAAAVAWGDDEHAAERRKIFTARYDKIVPALQDMGLAAEKPPATFYLWFPVPEKFGQSDIKFCLGLAERGVVASPSQWLSEGIKGFVRFALVPDEDEIEGALEQIAEFVSE